MIRASIDKRSFLAGGGEMGVLTREKDWGNTPLGPVDTWPQSLLTTLGLVLNARFPMFLWWGTELTCFYNDAYRPSLGNEGKHPSILGCPAKEAWPEIWHIISPLIHKVLAGEGGIWQEDQLIPIYRNGKIEDVYWTFSYSPVHDETGRVAGVLVVCNETTNKISAFTNLEQSEKRFRSIAESIGIKITLSGPEGKHNYYNKEWEHYTGHSAEDLLSYGWHELLHPDDRQATLDSWSKALPHGKAFRLEYRLRRRDGQYRWQQSQVIPQQDSAGNILVWVSTVTDVHEQKTFTQELERQVHDRTRDLAELNAILKNSEERYHLMVEEVQDYAILYLDREGIVRNWNRGAEKIKGYKAEEIIGRSFSNFYTEKDRRENLPQQLLKIAVENGRAVQEGWRVRKDGSLFWASVVITAVHNEQQEVIGFSKVTHDLTEKKAASDKIKWNAAQLEMKNRELEKMNAELQSFAYVASHDLQEPLRKIQTFSDRILDKEAPNLSDHGRDYLRRLRLSAKRMQTLIQDLLTYSRTNSTERVFVKTDLNIMLSEVKQDMKETIAEKNAVIESGDLCEATIIQFQFRQLLHNLFSNSLKFSRPGIPPHITISSRIIKGSELAGENIRGLEDISPQKEYCHIGFSDNGIGFEPEYADLIFKVFQRLHGKNEYAGTGIGLAIVRKIIENHHGYIIASGYPNEGARFDIYIPA